MKVALAQINTTVGDIRGNLGKIRSFYRRACGLGAELVLFPELSIPGYPALDLLEQPDFIRANLKALRELSRESRKTGLLVGYVDVNASRRGKPIHDAAALLHRGKISARRYKTLLPTYDVFDEARYFEPAPENRPIPFLGRRLGVTICEDAWNDSRFWRRRLYRSDPVERLARAGADLLLNLSASPYHRGKIPFRESMLRSQVRKTRKPLVYCNLAGGNDELIFDGNSLVLVPPGRPVALGRSFQEDLLIVDLDARLPSLPARRTPDAEEMCRALELGLRDYARKCGFRDALLGVSGGIDSALVCALACAALGPEHVTAVSMPSIYSSEGSVSDARALARNLGARWMSLPISPIFKAVTGVLGPAFRPSEPGLAEQNLQARIRGMLLMALSNKRGTLLLSTGNKSEMAVGYCTLYGDMNGGLGVIADAPKTTVYELARWINRRAGRELIPRSSIEKPPSAELKPGQKDQDDLPPYETLDAVLRAYVEAGRGASSIIRDGHPRALVLDVLARVDRNEYKRRQAAPGLRITPKAFGIGRRMPIARGNHRA